MVEGLTMLLVVKRMATKSCFYFQFKGSVAKCHVDYELNERTKLISVYWFIQSKLGVCSEMGWHGLNNITIHNDAMTWMS
jgi:hypothetical protein